MSERERWIVYPLLLLSIGLAMRSGMQLQAERHEGRVINADLLRCKTLAVVGGDGENRVTIGTSISGNAVLETNSADGIRQALLTSNPTGATLTLYDHEGKKKVVLGHDGPIIGLVVGYEGGKQFFPLAIVPLLRPTPPHDNAKSPEEPTPGSPIEPSTPQAAPQREAEPAPQK